MREEACALSVTHAALFPVLKLLQQGWCGGVYCPITRCFSNHLSSSWDMTRKLRLVRVRCMTEAKVKSTLVILFFFFLKTGSQTVVQASLKLSVSSWLNLLNVVTTLPLCRSATVPVNLTDYGPNFLQYEAEDAVTRLTTTGEPSEDALTSLLPQGERSENES